jgi:phage terminase large subunit GpA-like protein
MRCVELLRIEVNPVTPGAFRMRIARMLHRQRKGLGSLADLFPDLPPVRFDQLSGEEFATFGNMAAIVSDLPLMAYWAAPKRRRNKRSHSTSRVANQTRGPSDDDRS